VEDLPESAVGFETMLLRGGDACVVAVGLGRSRPGVDALVSRQSESAAGDDVVRLKEVAGEPRVTLSERRESTGHARPGRTGRSGHHRRSPQPAGPGAVRRDV